MSKTEQLKSATSEHSNADLELRRLALEQRKADDDLQLKTKEHELRLLEVSLKERELAIKERDFKRAAWLNPFSIGLLAAALGLVGNAAVALINGYQNRDVETRKAEYARVLEMIKVGSPDAAADNLQMLLKAGLYSDEGGRLAKYLSERTPGRGGFLPSEGRITAFDKPVAELLVRRIIEVVGIQQEFVLEESEKIRDAAATVRGNTKVVIYNRSFMQSLVASSETNWPALLIENQCGRWN